jgi:hypothetical protein
VVLLEKIELVDRSFAKRSIGDADWGASRCKRKTSSGRPEIPQLIMA